MLLFSRISPTDQNGFPSSRFGKKFFFSLSTIRFHKHAISKIQYYLQAPYFIVFQRTGFPQNNFFIFKKKKNYTEKLGQSEAEINKIRKRDPSFTETEFLGEKYPRNFVLLLHPRSTRIRPVAILIPLI